jgi:hypothetical protein
MTLVREIGRWFFDSFALTMVQIFSMLSEIFMPHALVASQLKVRHKR